MTTKVSIGGVIQDEAEARIPVMDRGFLYGDSVYEVIRTYRGTPFLLEEHLVRLQRSANQLSMTLPGGLEPIRADVAATVRAAGNPESYIRVIVTRGSGPILLDPSTSGVPRRVIIVAPFHPHPAELYEHGATVHLVATGRSDCGILAGAKSGNYLINVLALGEAKRRGGHEAILLDHRGRITEGASSNLFLVRGRQLETPPLEAGILEGITRHQVIGLARGAGLEVVEKTLVPDDLRTADEVFLTSTLREVLPVRQVVTTDGDPLRADETAPGPVTQELLQAYHQLAGVGDAS